MYTNRENFEFILLLIIAVSCVIECFYVIKDDLSKRKKKVKKRRRRRKNKAVVKQLRVVKDKEEV